MNFRSNKHCLVHFGKIEWPERRKIAEDVSDIGYPNRLGYIAVQPVRLQLQSQSGEVTVQPNRYNRKDAQPVRLQC